MEWDFNANQEVDEATLTNAPEGFRGAYEKGEDDKFRIAAGYKPFVEAITGLNGALRNERNNTKTLKGQKDVSDQLRESLGFESLDEAKAKFEELQQAVSTQSKVDPAKIKAEIQKTFDGEIVKKDQEIGNMRGTLNRFMVESAAVSALAEARGNPKLLMPIVREQVELVADGEDYVVRVKDGQGDYRGDGKGGFMSVADLVLEMRAGKDYSAAFESDIGGGTNSGNPRPGVQQRSQIQRIQADGDMSANDRIQRGLESRRRR
jgi:hypothetical protein